MFQTATNTSGPAVAYTIIKITSIKLCTTADVAIWARLCSSWPVFLFDILMNSGSKHSSTVHSTAVTHHTTVCPPRAPQRKCQSVINAQPKKKTQNKLSQSRCVQIGPQVKIARYGAIKATMALRLNIYR